MQGGGVVVGLLATTAALLVWMGCRSVRLRRRGPVVTRLLADASGDWWLQADDGWRAVSLSRFWRGPCWVTLALSSADVMGRPVMFTVWRSAVPATDWRTLCVALRARSVRTVRNKQVEAA